jgi:hypothetical protein
VHICLEKYYIARIHEVAIKCANRIIHKSGRDFEALKEISQKAPHSGK